MHGGQRFQLCIDHSSFRHAIGDPQVVFHGINKRDSLAMSNALLEAYQWAGRGDQALSHYRIGGDYDDFRDRVDRSMGRAGFVVGHNLFGALAPVPNRIWITQFRHPLPRALSCYQWLKNKHVAAHGSDAGYPTLTDFVRKTRGISHSQVVQFGCAFGRNSKARRTSAAAADLFEIAVDEIESDIYAIGIAEHFEESIFTFAALCGLSSVAPWIRDDRNKNRPLVDQITDSEREVIEEVYSYDYKLYKFALDRFWRQTQALKLEGNVSLAEYKAACLDQYKDRIVRA